MVLSVLTFIILARYSFSESFTLSAYNCWRNSTEPNGCAISNTYRTQVKILGFTWFANRKDQSQQVSHFPVLINT